MIVTKEHNMKIKIKLILVLMAVLTFTALQATNKEAHTGLPKQGKAGAVKFQIPMQDERVDVNRIQFRQLSDGTVMTFIPMQEGKHLKMLTYRNDQLIERRVWDGQYEFVNVSADGSRLFLNEFKTNEKGIFESRIFVIEKGRKLISYDEDISNRQCDRYYLTSYPNGKFLVITDTDGTATIDKLGILGFNNFQQNLMLKSPTGSLRFMSLVVNDETNTLFAALENGSIICFSLPEFLRIWSINVDQFSTPVFYLIPLNKDRVLGESNNRFILIDGREGKIITQFSINEIRNRFRKTKISLSPDMTASTGEVVLVETKNGKTTDFDLNGKTIKEYNNSKKFKAQVGRPVHFKRAKHSLRTFAIFKDSENLVIEEVE